MLIFTTAEQAGHDPAHEIFRGQRVPCFENPSRAAFVEQALRAAGHTLRRPDTDSADLLSQVHLPRYLQFLRSAWGEWLALDAANAGVQPFPSVWPVRTLRSDVEPANFIARLGLYSMDNGSPMVAGTWVAAKAAADAAASAARALGQGERAVFCATRPPGHHAGPDFMGGYCFINHAAVCAQALRDQGHVLRAPDVDSTPWLTQVHAPRYLDFLRGAWHDWLALDAANADRQPFPSVWPVRTLRSDVEPRNFIARLGLYSMDNGSPLSPGTWAAAKAAADCAASAARALGGGARAAFSASRPPGHHAGRDFMGGYCFINHAAVAAQALRDGGAARVAVLDVDYHHGNGTQAIFYERADVLFVSIHGDPRTEYPF